MATYKRKHLKLRRNDPCPCGSGVKYKKCCNKEIVTYQQRTFELMRRSREERYNDGDSNDININNGDGSDNSNIVLP